MPPTAEALINIISKVVKMAKIIDRFEDKYFFLSNFYPSLMVYEGYKVQTAEHAFQLAKTTHNEERSKVASESRPGGAKRRGRQLTLRPDWEDIKVDVMREVLQEKFSHPELKNKLLDTGDATLVEGNTWHDNFWGDCVCEKCKVIPGRNMLGKLLMELRESLR